MTRVRSTFHFWFVTIQEPRSIRVVMFAYYIFSVVAGLAIFADGPAILIVHSEAFALLDGALFFVGGLVGAASVFPGQWGLERIALLSLVFALLLRATILGAFTASHVSPWIILGQLALLVYRYLSIRKADLAPILPG